MNLKILYLRSATIIIYSVFWTAGKREGLPEQHVGFGYLVFSSFTGVPDDNFFFTPSEHDTDMDNKSTGISRYALILKKDKFSIYYK